MFCSIYCFCITRSQQTDEKGIQEEMWNNSVQSVPEQKVKGRNTLYDCNRIGLETVWPSPTCQGSSAKVPQGKEFQLHHTLTKMQTQLGSV